jgi:hypothetical protein
VAIRGNVKVDYQTDRGLVEITAGEMVYYLEQGNGFCIDVTARFAEEFFFTGDRLEIIESGRYFHIEQGVITACNQPTPKWSIKIREARIEREGYAVIKGAKFRIARFDLLYIPYMVAPAMQQRRTGLLTPKSGNASRNGAFFSQPFYWAPREDFDLTLTPTYYDKAGTQLGMEIRYRPSWRTRGLFQANYYEDRIIDSARELGVAPTEDGAALSSGRYRLKWKHDQPLFGGRFGVRVNGGSDFSVDRDYLEDADKTRLRDYVYRARFDKRFGRDQLTVAVNDFDRVLAANEDVVGLRSAPDIRYYQPNRDIGGGFYFRNQLYLGHYALQEIGPGKENGDFYRAGVDTEVSRPFGLFRFLRGRWGAAYRGVHLRERGGDDRDGGAGGGFGFLEFVGPRLKRNYEVNDRKLLHFLDFTTTIRAGQQEEDPFLESIRLDELDIRILDQAEGLQAVWRIDSRLFYGGNSLRPLFELEISQAVDLEKDDDDPEEPSTIDARLRLINLAGFYANGVVEFDPDAGVFDTLSFYGSVNRGDWRGYAGYVKRRREAEGVDQASRENFIGISEVLIPSLRSRFRVAVDYDLEGGDFKSQEFLYGWQGQCVGASFSYIKSPFDSRRIADEDYFRFTLSLRNLSELGSRF